MNNLSPTAYQREFSVSLAEREYEKWYGKVEKLLGYAIPLLSDLDESANYAYEDGLTPEEFVAEVRA
jgi:hypothetical protein